LYTAWLLARHGMPVSIFEQAPALDPEPRTLIVTREMLELLGPLGEASLLRPVHRFEIQAGGRTLCVPLEQPDWVIERAKLITALAEHALAAGAELRLGWRFVGLETVADRAIRLKFARRDSGEGESVESHIVIGADGAASRLAQAAGWSRPQTALLLQAVVSLPENYPNDTVRVWFLPEQTPYFFWLIPADAGQGVLGLIAETGAQARTALLHVLEQLELKPLAYQGGQVPLYTGWVPVHRRLGACDVYLVGDAAAQVKVSTVGGVVTGFRGARAVAAAIVSGNGHRELHALRRELNVHLWLRRVLHQFDGDDYGRLLELLNERSRLWLGRCHRDRATLLLRRLCWNQPRLLWLALRALLGAGR
jgi:digeranylgeranylglycerophospholipid reductase